VPFTKARLAHSEVLRGEDGQVGTLAAAADAAVAAVAGAVNIDKLDLGVVRELAKHKRKEKRKIRSGMEIPDDDVLPGDLGDAASARLRAMDVIKAKAGSIFGAALTAGDFGAIDFMGDFL
jgi:hypothetical protein